MNILSRLWNKQSMEIGVLLFEISLPTMKAWGELFYEGTAPSLTTCRKIVAAVNRGENAEIVAKKARLISLPAERAQRSNIVWIRIVGGTPPEVISDKIRKWKALGADLLQA